MSRVELHLHLEGAAPPAFIRGLARERAVDLSGLFDEQGHYAPDAPRRIRTRAAIASVLTRPEDHARLLRAVLEERHADDVVYVEALLSPDLCCGSDLPAWREHVAALREAAEAGGGITLRLIATALRHAGPERARAAALCAAETAGAFVVGFGLAGDERVLEPEAFAWSFDLGREAGLRLTAEAGEDRGPDAIRATLRDLRVDRIGHGARAIEDLALVDDLAEAGTVLEACPGAEIARGLVTGWRRHPVGELYRRGVKLTLSTDAPAFARTTLDRDCARLHEAFDWDEGVFRELNLSAARAAFCDEATRAALIRTLEAPCST